MNLKNIRERQKMIIDQLKSEGIPIATGPAADQAREILREALLMIFKAFPKEIHSTDLCFVNVYEGKYYPSADAFMNSLENVKTGESVQYMLVALEVFEANAEYLLLVLLHELAHVLLSYGEDTNLQHGELFEAQLEVLIQEFNRIYGTEIVNDWAGYGRI